MFTIELAESRKLAQFGQPDEAVKKLAAAHHLAWKIFGKREIIVMPIDQPLSPRAFGMLRSHRRN